MNYDELGDLREADWGALSRDEPERPPDRRRPPARTPAVEERNRREARERAEFRARSIANVAEDVTLDDLAERLGIDARLADEVYEYALHRRPLRPETLHALGVVGRRRSPRSEMVQALGGEDSLLRPAVERASAKLLENGGEALPALTPHSCRRTFASILVATGADPLHVADQLGHTDPGLSLRVYAQTVRRKDGALEALRALVEGADLPGVPAAPETTELAEESA